MGGNGMGPGFSLVMLAAVLIMGASNWRQRRIRRAVRDLPTRLRRQLGEGPEFLPPDEVPEELGDYVALHRRADFVVRVVWVISGLWLVYVLYLEMGAGT
jgi:hypothetical protein